MERTNSPESGNPSKKIVLAPCTGVGKVLGTISRQAAYEVVDNILPEETVLLCIPAFCASVREDIEIAHRYPSIIIEGCRERCAEKIFAQKNVKPAVIIYIPTIIKETKLKPNPGKRNELGPTERKLVNIIAQKVAYEAKKLFREP